tara:strand:+ start:3673 stop:3960 length:288 start_codon:yes stop_codon:yes gene_type:complete
MPLPKVRKKPTIKEMAGVLIELNQKIEMLHRNMVQLDNVLGHYIEFNKDLDKFNLYLSKVREEHDKKANDNPDKSNLQGDTDGEGSGTKGIRKKK